MRKYHPPDYYLLKILKDRNIIQSKLRKIVKKYGTDAIPDRISAGKNDYALYYANKYTPQSHKVKIGNITLEIV